jgi:CheY-like chemotaxis protein
MKKYNLLLVDDDPFILEGMGEDLENRGYLVTRASSGDRAMVAAAPGDLSSRTWSWRRPTASRC